MNGQFINIFGRIARSLSTKPLAGVSHMRFSPVTVAFFTNNATSKVVSSPPISPIFFNVDIMKKVLMNEPTPARREISDPLRQLRVEIIPPPSTTNGKDFSLPEITKEELVEPPRQNIYEKRAARLLVIRRAKMKKHKWRKLQKRMKYEFAKRRQRRELKKEKAFQAMLLAKVKEAEKWDVESFISTQISRSEWQRPTTHVRGFFAPDWVIKDEERAAEEAKRIEARIEECLRFKK